MAAPALADGFEARTLGDVNPTASAFVGGAFEVLNVSPKTLVLMCIECPRSDRIEIALNLEFSRRANNQLLKDLFGDNITISDAEVKCKSVYPECTITPLIVGTAIGWVQDRGLPAFHVKEGTLKAGDDFLSISVTATHKEDLERNWSTALTQLVPQIVGGTK